MGYYATISELIESIDEEEITYRTLHTNLHIRNKDEIIKIPYKSLVSEYMQFFQESVVTAEFTDDEKDLYRYKPKKLSYDLYGTTELWSALMELNNILSITEFNTDNIKVFAPDEFKQILNEAMIMEGILE